MCAERDDLRALTRQLARIVQVLVVENQQLKAANSALEQQLAARTGVPDLQPALASLVGFEVAELRLDR